MLERTRGKQSTSHSCRKELRGLRLVAVTKASSRRWSAFPEVTPQLFGADRQLQYSRAGLSNFIAAGLALRNCSLEPWGVRLDLKNLARLWMEVLRRTEPYIGRVTIVACDGLNKDLLCSLKSHGTRNTLSESAPTRSRARRSPRSGWCAGWSVSMPSVIGSRRTLRRSRGSSAMRSTAFSAPTADR